MPVSDFSRGFYVLGKNAQPKSSADPGPVPVIPVVFLPGIMGSTLRVKPSCVEIVRRRFEEDGRGDEYTDQAWRPPSLLYSKFRTVGAALWEALGGNCQAVRTTRTWERYGPKFRQVLLNPETAEVDEQGFIPRFIPGLARMDGRPAPAVARERGWGSVHWDIYWKILRYLENALNPGFQQAAFALRSRRMHVDQALAFSGGFDFFKWVRPNESEIAKAVQYRYPVHAVGYNWTQSNLQSAEDVLARIKACVQGYQAQGAPCRQVVLVTHSMGGLVARVVAQLAPEGLILGVVHGVMPAIGAPVAYRRMVGGTEHDNPMLIPELSSDFRGRPWPNLTALPS